MITVKYLSMVYIFNIKNNSLTKEIKKLTEQDNKNEYIKKCYRMFDEYKLQRPSLEKYYINLKLAYLYVNYLATTDFECAFEYVLLFVYNEDNQKEIKLYMDKYK